MKQLVLNLRPDTPPTLENFVTGANHALLATLATLASGNLAGLPCPHLYLWGEASCGRSHLLQATVTQGLEHQRPATCFSAAHIPATLPETPSALIAIDDIHQLEEAGQIALFNAFNRAPRLGQSLLLAGNCAPRALSLREDLRTRIGQALIFEVQPLDDETRAAILNTLANRRGLTLAEEVQRFLLHHGRRDLPSLLATFEALDTASLEHKRPITLPLLRSMQQQGLII